MMEHELLETDTKLELDAEEFKKRLRKWDEFRKGRDLETIYKEVFESVLLVAQALLQRHRTDFGKKRRVLLLF